MVPLAEALAHEGLTMPKRPKDQYATPATYRGDWDECYLCGGEKLLWKVNMLCVVCDNRDDNLRASWFQNFVDSEGR
jgi:hypothetical protein